MLRFDLQFFGGRGAASGVSDAGKRYGSEYTTLHSEGNIKFVRYNDSGSAKAPMETRTRGRVYVTVNKKDELVTITYVDNQKKRVKSIDLTHAHLGIIPHTHNGYEHAERGTTRLTPEEKAMVDRVRKAWQNKS